MANATPDYLTSEEIDRLHTECEQFSKVGVIRMMNNATAHIPGATAAIRQWLEAAEAENESFCEVCGKPAEYDDEVILCKEHEPKDDTSDGVPLEGRDPPEASLYADDLAERLGRTI